MSFATIYPRTVRSGASFQEVADGEFPVTERQGANFVGTTRDIGISNHAIRKDSGGWRRRYGLKWTVRLGPNFSDIFTRSGIIGNLAPDAWFKGDEEVTLVGTEVSAWGDLSGHSRDTVQATSNQRPTTAELNGIQTLSTITGKSLDFFSSLSAKSAVFVVNNYQPADTSPSSVVFGENDSTPFSSDYVFLRLNASDYTISLDGNFARPGNASVDNGILVSGTDIDLGVDFVSGDGPNWFYVDWSDASVPVDYISRFITNSGDVSGSLEVAEIAFFPTVLTAQQRTDVYEKYLKPLWGLS